jgi:hypothetical protein
LGPPITTYCAENNLFSDAGSMAYWHEGFTSKEKLDAFLAKGGARYKLLPEHSSEKKTYVYDYSAG